jgi:hypothetical protein
MESTAEGYTNGVDHDAGSMGLWEAQYWCIRRPQEETLRALYPALSSEKKRLSAWVDDNRAKIREATTTFIAFHANKLYVPSFSTQFSIHPLTPSPPGASINPSGSLFACSDTSSHLPIYWDPAVIILQHEGFTYTVSAPSHVAELHAFRDWPRAFEYLQAHCDSRETVKPMVFTVPAAWHPDVFAGETHPDAVPDAPHDAAAFPVWRDAKEASVGKGKIRYTLYGWRKRDAYTNGDTWRERQHYFAENYDLKEVLDTEGKVVGSERRTDSQEPGL